MVIQVAQPLAAVSRNNKLRIPLLEVHKNQPPGPAIFTLLSQNSFPPAPVSRNLLLNKDLRLATPLLTPPPDAIRMGNSGAE